MINDENLAELLAVLSHHFPGSIYSLLKFGSKLFDRFQGIVGEYPNVFSKIGSQLSNILLIQFPFP